FGLGSSPPTISPTRCHSCRRCTHIDTTAPTTTALAQCRSSCCRRRPPGIQIRPLPSGSAGPTRKSGLLCTRPWRTSPRVVYTGSSKGQVTTFSWISRRRSSTPWTKCSASFTPGRSLNGRTWVSAHGPEMNLHLFLGYCLAVAILVLMPGPIVTLVIASSLNHGSRSGFATVAGASIGNAILLGATAVGLVAFFALLSEIFEVVRWAGAGYLIWLGVKAWRANSGQ